MNELSVKTYYATKIPEPADIEKTPWTGRFYKPDISDNHFLINLKGGYPNKIFIVEILYYEEFGRNTVIFDLQGTCLSTNISLTEDDLHELCYDRLNQSKATHFIELLNKKPDLKTLLQFLDVILEENKISCRNLERSLAAIRTFTEPHTRETE